jgi:adenine-specific DNA-methyltransferase
MHPVADAQIDLWPATAPAELAGRPTELAYWHGSLLSRSRSRDEQRSLGQFMTPAPIARLMAERLVAGRDWAGRAVRLLDPAAGSGVLAAALVEAALSSGTRPARIELLLCELDESMLPLLRNCARELGLSCARHGVEFDCQVQGGDFLASALAQSGQACVDAVIANPPYFKLAGRDPRARAFAHAVHGQPNIYALFMASCASLLRPGGGFCFITPRSWTNGAYFRALRKHLLDRMAVDGLHLFDSREAHFQADAVLQEALIVWATAGRPQGAIAASSSHGLGDLQAARPTRWQALHVLGPAPQHTVSIPDRSAEPGLADMPLRLHDLGLKVVTGPVVGFRAAKHLRSQATPGTVPMLWMPHVRSMQIDWPRAHRAEHIDANDASAWMLLPNQPMVLIRRFSPKEDARRVTAAPYLGGLPGQQIGLENHLNVIRPVAGSLSREAVQGLAAYLNSLPVDRYLRRLLGSTQVNAIELRHLPVPELQTLEAIARALPSAASLDDAVATICRFDAPAHAARHG